MKFKSEDLSLAYNEYFDTLYASALIWLIGKFDEESMSWIEFEKPEFIELDNPFTVPSKETVNRITKGVLPLPSDFPSWIEWFEDIA